MAKHFGRVFHHVNCDPTIFNEIRDNVKSVVSTFDPVLVLEDGEVTRRTNDPSERLAQAGVKDTLLTRQPW